MAIKDLADFQRKLDKQKDFYAQRNENFLAWRASYFMEPESVFLDKKGNYRPPEPDEQRVVLPIAYNLVESFRELLLAKSPSISVPQSSIKGESLEQADNNEKVLLAVWERADVYERLRDAMWHALVDGWGVMQLVWRPGEDMPVKVLHHDPYHVYAMPNATLTGWEYVINSYERLVGSIRDEWADIADGRSKLGKSVKETLERFDIDKLDDTDTITYFDYWDSKENCVGVTYSAKDEHRKDATISAFLKEPANHGYGCLPWYIMLPCRLPFNNKGERMGVSIIYPLYEIIKYKDVAISQKATMATRYYDPPLVTITEMGEDIEPVRTEAGLHLRLKNGEDAKYLVHPGPPPAADVLMQQIDEYIETAGLPRVLQGLYTGAASGVAMSLLRNPTLMRVAFKQKEIEKTAEKLNADILRLISNKAGSAGINLWGVDNKRQNFDIVASKESIGGYYRNSVKLSASLPSDDASTVNMIVSLITSNVLSAKTARDVAQQTLHELVPQSLIDEQKQILIEKALQDPGMIQALAAELAKEADLVYLTPKGENPQGGYGDAVPGMPAGTLPSQTPQYPTGNTKPDAAMQLQEMMKSSPQGQAGIAPEEMPNPVGRSANVGNTTVK